MWLKKSTARLSRGAVVRALQALAFVSGWCLATARYSTFEVALSKAADMEECPTCDTLFTKVDTSASGKRVQDIVMQERGEPKSGTTFMCNWARMALDRTCKYLRLVFGENTCSTDDESGALTFEPRLAADKAKCPCHNVDLVRIEVSPQGKHKLPLASVHGTCALAHKGGFGTDMYPCGNGDEATVENAEDLWACMQKSGCYTTDYRHQFVIMRDPRPVAVSTYFHMKRFAKQTHFVDMGVDDAVMRVLPAICQWVTIRHFLFEGIMSNQSTVFWYQDAVNDPLQWHHRLTAALGIQLPSSWVESISEVNVHRSVLNVHPGGEAADSNRTWQDEISPELVDKMDAVLKVWLPPVILARLGLMAPFAHG